jgi:hypothetical protein
MLPKNSFSNSFTSLGEVIILKDMDGNERGGETFCVPGERPFELDRARKGEKYDE